MTETKPPSTDERRAIVALPDFEDRKFIDSVREQFDPMAKVVPPHVVLVFPFQSNIPGDVLSSHVKDCLSGISRFPILLQGVSGFADRFLLMNVKVGNDEIIFAHDKLYGGLLQPLRQPRYTFFPHVSLGVISDQQAFFKVLQSLAAMRQEVSGEIRRIAVQRFPEGKPPEIEFEVELASDE